jgi:hypothetical protein
MSHNKEMKQAGMKIWRIPPKEFLLNMCLKKQLFTHE